MENKVITIVSLSLLFITFGIVSFLVIITKRNPYFVSKKLRLGALILTLSGISMFGGCRDAVVGCYFTFPENTISINENDLEEGEIISQKGVTDTISGTIRNRNGDEFSYAIVDSSKSIITKNDLLPDDGVFDENYENFTIALNTNIPTGTYELRFYSFFKNSIDNKINSYIWSYNLTIKN